jgi:cell division protease FtsH
MRDSWLPVGFRISRQAAAGAVREAGQGWQIVATSPDVGRVLLATPALADRWFEDGHLGPEVFNDLEFGAMHWKVLWGGASHQLSWIPNAPPPETESEALSFAVAYHETRKIDERIALGDAVFVERYSRLLPTYSSETADSDEVIVGRFLTGGVEVSCLNLRRMEVLLGWLPPRRVRDVIAAAGVGTFIEATESDEGARGLVRTFRLPGRPELERFFQDHVIDIIANEERYRALGIEFPPAVVLQGPPGCGKTYAVHRLTDYLSWPCFEIESGSIGSPYIHETGRKISEVFEKARASAPCVIVMDEMEAFLSSRDVSLSSHHLEEVAEFLRLIPEARRDHVLVVGMTNRIDLIDPALLRRGRFDHIVEVGPPSIEEVTAVLEDLLTPLPHEPGLPVSALAQQLEGSALSDVAFVVREGARLSAKAGLAKISSQQLVAALEGTRSRGRSVAKRGIGFLPV